MTPEPRLPIETHPRPRQGRCPECGRQLVLHDGRLAQHDRRTWIVGDSAKSYQCPGSGLAPTREPHEMDVEPEPSGSMLSSAEWLERARLQAHRFWAKVEKVDGRCWLWRGGKDKDGYGKFQIDGPRTNGRQLQKHVRAHRLAWELTNGAIPRGKLVLHACDTPACVNPSHLEPGTQKKNCEDCSARGRTAKGQRNGANTKRESKPRGVAHPRATLTDGVVRQIREYAAEGLGARRIATRLGVGVGAVAGVLEGKTWKHVLAITPEAEVAAARRTAPVVRVGAGTEPMAEASSR